MAIKGLTIPVFADYSFNGTVVSYLNGFVCGHAIEYNVEIETSDDNPLYGDDRIIENDYGEFSTGTLTLNTSDLDQPTSKCLLNVKEISRAVGDTTVTELVYDDDAKPTPKGFGIIETHQIDDTNRYRAVVLAKIIPRIPSDAATTKEETIEWQTKELECLVERSDQDTADYKHPWKYEAWFDTHADALEYLKYVLNVLEQVTATSSAGSSAGQTVITITNPVAGASYKYSTTGPAPTYKQDLASWTELTSGEAITAENGSTLYIAQVDSDDKAVGAGTVTVVANGGV